MSLLIRTTLIIGCILLVWGVQAASVSDISNNIPIITNIPTITNNGVDGSMVVHTPIVKAGNPVVSTSIPVSTKKSTLEQSASSTISFTYVDQFGSGGSGNGYFNYPYGVVLDNQGYIYVVDRSNNRIQKFNSNKKFLSSWGTYGSNWGQFKYPTDIAKDSLGYLYVVDSGNDRVQKFDTNGEFITSFGSYGSTDGKFKKPLKIAIGKDNAVYVADTDNHRVQKFSSSGTFLTSWGVYGTGDTGFKYPVGIAVDSSNMVYVGDSGNDRIVKYSSDGNWNSIWKVENEFNGPANLIQGPDKNIYISDDYIDKILVYSTNGVKMGEIGSGGYENGYFRDPFGMAFDSTGTYAYVADSSNNRIQIFKTNFVSSKPVISSISPTSGCSGAIPFTIKGKNFKSGLTVNFTNTGCTLTNTGKYVDSTTISGTVTIPASPCSSQYNVVVTNPGNQKSSETVVFKIACNKPVVKAVYPKSGARNILLPFLITGTNLKGSNQVVTLTKSGAKSITATNVSAINSKQVFGTFMIPASAKTGNYQVKVKWGTATSTDKVYFKVN